MLWGLSSQASTWLIIAGVYAFGLLPGQPIIIYFCLVALINLGFFLIVRFDLNLRFKDPSLTAAQIITPMWPAIYIMFFVTDSQARMAFLLMAVGGMLFGTLALSRRAMLDVGALTLVSYLLLLATLHSFAPERVNLHVEAIIVFAYGAVLMIVAYLGSYITGMRKQLKEQNRKLADLAARDPLTRLPNRRSLMDQLTEEVARADRRSPEQQDLCISMLDVDHFKHINDTWGHDAGDIVLCKISDVLRESMRQGDFIGRFGGEEFVIIFPESTREAAEHAAERIRAQIGSLRFPGLPENQRVTVSQGVAIYQEGEKITDTLKRADDALYKAKSSGRNLVVIA